MKLRSEEVTLLLRELAAASAPASGTIGVVVVCGGDEDDATAACSERDVTGFSALGDSWG